VSVQILQGDCRQVLASLPAASVHCCVTSPPYFGLRDYGVPEQIGLEQTPAEFVEQMVLVFREVRRVLRDDGTLWLNLGDSYARSGGEQGGGNQLLHMQGIQSRCLVPPAGLKHKDLIGIPWRVALALQADGWYLRQDIIWHKPNPMPESVRDRCTKAHEYVFLLSKSERYFWDRDAMQEEAETPADRAPRRANSFARKVAQGQPPGVPDQHREGREDISYEGTRNRRSVWTIATQPFAEAHFATMAPELAETCIKAGCPVGGTVLDPFGGAGTTGLVADQLQRNATLIELNPDYVEIARRRISADAPLFSDVEVASQGARRESLHNAMEFQP